jgi:hypothetical protein
MTTTPKDDTINDATVMLSSHSVDCVTNDLTGYALAVALPGKNRETNA